MLPGINETKLFFMPTGITQMIALRHNISNKCWRYLESFVPGSTDLCVLSGTFQSIQLVRTLLRTLQRCSSSSAPSPRVCYRFQISQWCKYRTPTMLQESRTGSFCRFNSMFVAISSLNTYCSGWGIVALTLLSSISHTFVLVWLITAASPCNGVSSTWPLDGLAAWWRVLRRDGKFIMLAHY